MNVGFHGNLVIVYGRIEAHRIDAIATPSPQVAAENSEINARRLFGPRIIGACAKAYKIYRAWGEDSCEFRPGESRKSLSDNGSLLCPQ
jgi:hypothetical protein